ncbi:MAG: V-type ATP synthase subunit I, partial [Nitrospinaceae bacterium]|nr:V-type ATP synthase subunit I [Nitrospinaceae bacterium]
MALNLPHIPLSTCRDGLATCLAREFSLKNRLDDYANRHLSELRERIVLAGDELAYRNLLRNIEVMEDHRVVIMEGWCPEERSEELEKLLGARGVMVIRAEPDGEPAPVLLRNNRFTRLFEPIGRLFSLPAYSEMDLTAYFAPFFLLFFGFCLGDAGYGLILL